jgi:hypothetical protein
MGRLRGHMHPSPGEIARDPSDAGAVDEDHHDQDRDAERDLQEVEGCGNHFDGQLGQRVGRDHAILVSGAAEGVGGPPSILAPVA